MKNYGYALIILIAFSVAGCHTVERTYEPEAQLTTRQWCARAVKAMGSYYVAEQAREALLETARNRGCFSAPPNANVERTPDEQAATCLGDLLDLKYGNNTEGQQRELRQELKQNQCGQF
jgi:hypothetical protein